ncbi:enoyl-CoA hydratase/isomerase family protein [Dactylosporangium sp. NPDC051485]|uniref:enoyl-CoA hydratase/isomerase family protein n=1 Tax=Dactylosporangium sp. NPDC051485 TaxID=3154846 RepID=UPI003449719A
MSENGQPPVIVEVHDAVGEIVLNAPHRLNAIDLDMLDHLDQRITELEADGAVRALIVRGNGRGFCSGASLDFLGDKFSDPDVFGPFLDRWHEVFARLSQSDLPSVAAVHGFALAGGFELMQACDLVVVADDAKMGDHHAQLGLFPGGGGTQRLPRQIGPRRAKWLLLTGEWVTPEVACEWGLVNEVVPAAGLLTRAREIAALLATRSAAATARIKRAVSAGVDLPLTAGLAVERRIGVAHMQSDDVRIGVDAFHRRAVPVFVPRRQR